MKEKIIELIIKIKLNKKANKFNISNYFLDTLANRNNSVEEHKILDIINKSKSKDEFNKNVMDYLKKTEYCPYKQDLMFGLLTGIFEFTTFTYDKIDKNIVLENLTCEKLDATKDLLKQNLKNYIYNNNELKNIFAENKDGIIDLSRDINEEDINKTFNEVISRKINKPSEKHHVVEKYIIKILGAYSKNDIINNFEKITEDLLSTEYKVQEIESVGLTVEEKYKIKNITLLIERLENINNKASFELLKRLNIIKNNYEKNIKELNDIYLEYEIINRQDLLDNLYVPEKNEIIEDFKNLKTQLIHMFIRSTNKLEQKLKSEIIEDIINNRNNSNKNTELTKDELIEYKKRCNIIDSQLDQTKVNYSFKSTGIYSDTSGLNHYKSDTSNQISASVYSEEYFIINSNNTGLVGIGFNKKTLNLEAISLLSNSYLTTNKGINNLEYKKDKEFQVMSSSFKELKKSNANSEIVLQRRGLDFDTLASYIFCTIDSSKKDESKIILDYVNQINKDNLKVVIYDLFKIKKSYEVYTNVESKNIEESNKKI